MSNKKDDLRSESKKQESGEITFYQPMASKSSKFIKEDHNVEKPEISMDISKNLNGPNKLKMTEGEYKSKSPLELTPEISQKSDLSIEEEKEIRIEDSGFLEVNELKKKKRNTVISLTKPKDERRETYKKTLILNEDAEN